MIDRLDAFISQRKHSGSSEGYTPEQAIVDNEILNPRSKSLTVIFPPWHGIDRLGRVIKKRAVKAGLALLTYTFHDEILSADSESVIGSFKHIQRAAADEINILRRDNGYADVHLVGFSLGNVALAMTAAELDGNFRTTCIVGSSNLARSAWEGLRTRHIREDFEHRQKYTENQLDQEWAVLAPGNNTMSFDGKPVHMVISKTDRFLPTNYQEELAAKMKNSGAELTVERTNNGHVSSIVKYAYLGEF